MSCKLNLKAPNGKDSQLFKDLLAISEDPKDAIEMYYYTKTPKFEKSYGKDKSNKKKFDENGEPQYEELAKNDYSRTKDYIQATLDTKADIYVSLVKAIPGMLTELDKQILGLKRRKESKGTTKLVTTLEELREGLSSGDPIKILPRFLKQAANHMMGVQKRVEKLMKNDPIGSMKEIAHMYKVAEGYSVISDFNDKVLNDEEARKILKLGENNFSGDAVQSGIVKVRAMYMKAAKLALTEELHKNSPSISRREIKSALDGTPQDLRRDEVLLEFAGDSKDLIVAMVAEMVINADHTNRRKLITLSKQINDRVLKMRKKYKSDEAMYGDLQYIKENGELHMLDIHSKDATERAKIANLSEDKKDFLNFYTETYETMQAIIPKYENMGTRMPTVLKGTIERMQGKSGTDVVKGLMDEVKKTVVKSNQDLQYGNATDANGNVVRSIPTFYTKKYDSIDYKKAYDKEYKELVEKGYKPSDAEVEAKARAEIQATKSTTEQTSRDMGNTLMAFSTMALNFGALNESIHLLEAAEKVVGSQSRSYGENADGTAKKTGIDSNTAKLVTGFLDMQVYGVKDVDLGKIGKADTAKVLRAIGKSNGLIQLSANIKAALANIGVGGIGKWIEGMSGEYFTIKDNQKANAFYAKNLGGVLADIGKTVPTNIVNLIEEHYGILQSFSRDQKSSERSKAVKLMNLDSLYMMNSSGEHYLQITTALAMMENTKVYDKKGVAKGSLLAQHSKDKNNNLVIAKDIYVKDANGNLTKYDDTSINQMSNKMTGVLRRMYGNYSSKTAQLAKKDARYALLLQFRGFAYDGLTRRYAKKDYNKMLGQDVEGFYRTGAKFTSKLVTDLAKMRTDLAKEDWNALTLHEKANVIRFATEAGFIMALGASAALLSMAGKLSEDDFDSNDPFASMKAGAFALSVYEVNRLYTEMFAFSNPWEAFLLLRSPFAATTMIESIGRFGTQLLNPFDEYESGWREGENKLAFKASKLIPVYKQFATLNADAIYESAMFFNR